MAMETENEDLGDIAPLDSEEEKRVFYAALESFRQYRKTAHYNVTHVRRQDFYALPTKHWQMLSEPPFNLLSNLERIDDAIDANADIADQIVESAYQLSDSPALGPDVKYTAAPHHLEKAKSTIRQIYRDWSFEGAAERRACHDPIYQDLELEFSRILDKSAIRVLVPGAGLGRLVLEICLKGYNVEGNEISWHQLMASNWILNHTTKDKTYDLYPFIAEFSNLISRDHQLKAFRVPDVHPGTALEEASEGSEVLFSQRLSISAGDFIGIYGKNDYNNMFDAVVTLFFIDTAPNLIRYIETLRNCLRSGGIWINLGPLLWHFSNRMRRGSDERDGTQEPMTAATSGYGIEEPGSFELTDEEVLLLVDKMGFDVVKHEIRSDGTGYIHNTDSMLRNNYRPSHWVARKRE